MLLCLLYKQRLWLLGGSALVWPCPLPEEQQLSVADLRGVEHRARSSDLACPARQLALDLVHLGSSLLQGLPVQIHPSEKTADSPTEEERSTGQWQAWTESVGGRGLSSDKEGSKKKLEYLRSSKVPKKPEA